MHHGTHRRDGHQLRGPARREFRLAGWRRVRLLTVSAVATLAVFAQTIGAEALTITTAPITFPSVTLTGASQTVNGSTSAWRADAVGETGGWHVTVASTDFSNAAAKTIAVSNFEIRLLDQNIVVVSGHPQGPSSTQTTFTALSGTSLKIASASGKKGDGVYDLTPDFRLTVPAETYTGGYSATVTVDVVVGP